LLILDGNPTLNPAELYMYFQIPLGKSLVSTMPTWLASNFQDLPCQNEGIILVGHVLEIRTLQQTHKTNHSLGSAQTCLSYFFCDPS